jgi:hypothetical protein
MTGKQSGLIMKIDFNTMKLNRTKLAGKQCDFNLQNGGKTIRFKFETSGGKVRFARDEIGGKFKLYVSVAAFLICISLKRWRNMGKTCENQRTREAYISI